MHRQRSMRASTVTWSAYMRPRQIWTPLREARAAAGRPQRSKLPRARLLTKAVRAARHGTPSFPTTPRSRPTHALALTGAPPLPHAGRTRDGVRGVGRQRGRAPAAGVGAGADAAVQRGVHLGSAAAAAAAAGGGGVVVRGQEARAQGGAGAQGAGGGGDRRAAADARLAQLQVLLPEEDGGRRQDRGRRRRRRRR
jgi:hypothetical protein